MSNESIERTFSRFLSIILYPSSEFLTLKSWKSRFKNLNERLHQTWPDGCNRFLRSTLGFSACKTYLNSVSNINGFDSCDFIISFCFKFVSPSKFAVSTKHTFCLSLDSRRRISAGIISLSWRRTISPGLDMNTKI